VGLVLMVDSGDFNSLTRFDSDLLALIV